MKKIGVVGCGTIGTQICKAIDEGKIAATLLAVSEIDTSKASNLMDQLISPCQILPLPELVSTVDIVVESAGSKVVPPLIELILKFEKQALIMSVGGLLEITSLFERFQNSASRLYIPSGAIAGLDAVNAAHLVEIQSVTLTTRKPPKGLKGAPFCIEKGIDLENLSQETVIFEGSARQAAKAFPKNINVAAALSLAGIGADKTKVRIIADPTTKTNSHEIEVQGLSGRIVTKTENVPSTFNPKTSFLAALSGIATLQKMVNPVKVGT